MSKSDNGHSCIDMGEQPPMRPTPLRRKSQAKRHPLSCAPQFLATDMCAIIYRPGVSSTMGGAGRLGRLHYNMISASPMHPRRQSQSLSFAKSLNGSGVREGRGRPCESAASAHHRWFVDWGQIRMGSTPSYAEGWWCRSSSPRHGPMRARRTLPTTTLIA